MHKLEEGILEDSEIYFCTPSDFAQNALFCLQHLGVFHCDERYEATHPYWESILLLFMDEGALKVIFDGQEIVARAGDAVMIDCRQKHSYKALGELRFHYIHFTGPGTKAYARQLYRLYHGVHISGYPESGISHIYRRLQNYARSQVTSQNEHTVSVDIHRILALLAENAKKEEAAPSNEAIENAVTYMNEHIDSPCSLEELAEHAGLSKYYFNRLFSSAMGMPPHRYYNAVRIQHAKRLLMTTSGSVEDISEQCGFDTPSNFIRMFKRYEGMTPTAFRRLPM